MKYLSYFLEVLLILIVASVLVLWAIIFLNNAPLSGEPGFFKRVAIYLTQNEAQTSKDSAREELKPIPYRVSTAQLYEATLKATKGMNWQLLSQNRSKRVIKARCRTRLFKLESDVEIRVHNLGGGKSTLDIHSVSLSEHADLGRNTNNILRLYQAIDTLYPTMLRD